MLSIHDISGMYEYRTLNKIGINFNTVKNYLLAPRLCLGMKGCNWACAGTANIFHVFNHLKQNNYKEVGAPH